MDSNDRHQPKTSGGQNRRIRYLINISFQRKYALQIAASVFVASAFMGAFLFWVLFQRARELAVLSPTTTLSSSAFIIIASSLGFAVVSAAAFGLWSITVTHRICGPMFVMERYLREMAAGKFPQKRPLRRKDAFKEFYDVLWRTLDSIKARKRHEFAQLSEAARLAKSAGSDNPQALRELAEQLDAMCVELASVLDEGYQCEPSSTEADREPSVSPGREHAEVSV